MNNNNKEGIYNATGKMNYFLIADISCRRYQANCLVKEIFGQSQPVCTCGKRLLVAGSLVGVAVPVIALILLALPAVAVFLSHAYSRPRTHGARTVIFGPVYPKYQWITNIEGYTILPGYSLHVIVEVVLAPR